MKFRPCIDIHNGRVKQIVGGSLRDAGDFAQENFVAKQSAADFARLYARCGLKGGHVILLNGAQSPYYEETRRQALAALAAYPGGLQLGGGVTPENAKDYLRAGASHVIVTSYVFRDGKLDGERLSRMKSAVGKEHLVLDVSCREKDGQYFVVTDRWQRFTDICVTEKTLDRLSSYCDEFLVHGVDVEGSKAGVEKALVRVLGAWAARTHVLVTYAGGIGAYEDISRLFLFGKGMLDYTVGSALDLFGGALSFEKLAAGYAG